ncbi:MAG: prolipoprotein diacylglyceryl transferase [Lachnospiraceae bacterium]|nr:prolipoprotein diacylglyceryl transferase [Lachnospiraceae bacterium]
MEENIMSWWGNETSVRFPNIGIEFNDLPRGFAIGSFKIAFYGVLIAMGMLGGIALSRWKARKTGQDQDIYLDFALWAIPFSVLGARLYYVIFQWDQFKDNWLNIFNIRQGGLAIYGGVIVAIVSVIIYTRIKKLNLGLMADTGIIGLILGQIVGRWGNFFNREVFGKFTDSVFAMQIDVSDKALSTIYNPSVVSESILRNMFAGKEDTLNNILEIRNNIMVLSDGRQFIQVHPTFLYESVWNILVLIILLIAWPKKKFNGEILLMYLAGYGFGRFFIEGIRTDQLYIWGTGLAVSQVLSAILFIVATVLIIVFRTKAIRSGEAEHVSLVLERASLKVKEEDSEDTSYTAFEAKEEKDTEVREVKDADIKDAAYIDMKVKEPKYKDISKE